MASCTDGTARPAGYYLLTRFQRQMVDELIEGGFTPREALREIVALVAWCKETS